MVNHNEMSELQKLTFKLLTLLGFKDIHVSRSSFVGDRWFARHPDIDHDIRGSVADPIVDDGAAFRLMVEHELVPNYLPYFKVGIVGYPLIKEFHPSDTRPALRIAIVKAVIAKLEAKI